MLDLFLVAILPAGIGVENRVEALLVRLRVLAHQNGMGGLGVPHFFEHNVELSFESGRIVATIVHDLGGRAREESAQPRIRAEQMRAAQHIKQEDRLALQANLDERKAPRRPQVPFDIDSHGLALRNARVDVLEGVLRFEEAVDQHVGWGRGEGGMSSAGQQLLGLVATALPRYPPVLNHSRAGGHGVRMAASIWGFEVFAVPARLG